MPATIARVIHASSSYLPIPKANKGQPQTRAPRAIPARVFVAQHHPRTRGCLCDWIREMGCSVRQACNGATALADIFESNPDVAILDLALPVLDGLSILADLKLLGGHLSTRVIVLCRSDESVRLEEAARLGAYDFLLKPLADEEVRAVLGLAVTPAERGDEMCVSS